MFFPHVSPAPGTLASFATYVAGFGARPIGAVVSGHFGDRLGRMAVLVGAVVMMGLVTTAIGVLPTYAQAGLVAPAGRRVGWCRIPDDVFSDLSSGFVRRNHPFQRRTGQQRRFDGGSDRIGRRPPYLFGAAASVVALTLFFLAAGSGWAIAVVLSIVFGVNIVHDAMYGPQVAWFAELFDTRVRYSGSSRGYQIGAVLSGGFAPLIAAALLAAGGGRPWLIVGYFAVPAGITVVSAYAARETREDSEKD